MMDTEEKYKVVIIDDERSASDALRRELEPYGDACQHTRNTTISKARTSQTAS